MTSSIVRSQDINIGNINHDKLKKRPSGAKSVRMTYEGHNLMIQLDRTRVPFGVSVYDKDPENVKYSLEVSLGGNEKMEQFREVLESIDNSNVDYCSDSSQAWWGKKMSKDVMVEGEVYKSLIKVNLDENGMPKGDHPPRFKVKLPMYDGKPMFKVFGNDKKEIVFATKDPDTGEVELDWSWARNGMEIKVLVECEGLWVVDKKIFCTWRAVQIRVLSSGNQMTNYAMIDDDDEEVVEEEEDDGATESSKGEEEDDEDEEDDDAYESE